MTADRVRLVCGWCVVLLSSVVLIGWFTEQPALVYLLPGNRNSMKFNTALCLLALGLVLLLAQKRGAWPRRIRNGALILVTVVAGLTLLELWGKWDFGIDQLVVKDHAPLPGSGAPGRMSDQAAYTFLLLVSSYELLNYRRGRRIVLSQILLLIASWITLLGVFGYVLQIQAFYFFLDSATTVASNTILGFMAVCVGMFCLSTNKGLSAVISSPQIGGRLSRMLMPWLLILPLALHWLNQAIVATHWITPTVGDGLVTLVTSSMLLGLLWYVAGYLNRQEEELQLRLKDSQESMRRFRQIVMQSPFPMVLHRSDGQILVLNQAWISLSGYELAEAQTVAAWCALVYDTEWAEKALAALAEIGEMKPGETKHFGGFVIRSKSGKLLTWDFHSSILGLDPEGHLLVLSSAMDITERSEAEEQLRALSDNLEHQVNQRTYELETIRDELEMAQRVASMGNWIYDVKANQITWSNQIFRIFGLEPGSQPPSFEEHLAQIHPQDRELWQTTVEQAIYNQRPYNIDFRTIWRDGSVHWVNGQGEIEADDQGNTTRLFGTALDVTNRKEAEIRLTKAEERFRLLLEQSPGVVYVSPVVPTLEHAYVSPQIEELLGVPQAAWQAGLFNTWKTYVHPEDFDWVFAEIRAAIAKRKPIDVEYRMVRADGQIIWVRDQGQLFTDPLDGTLLIQGLAIDITALKTAEATLQKKVADLDQRNREMQLLRQLSDFLQACQSLDEAAKVISSYGPQLFLESSGQLCLLDPEDPNQLVALLHWGQTLHSASRFHCQDCWALRLGTTHLYSPNHLGTPLTCHHLISSEADDLCQACLPMTAFGETIGHLFIEAPYATPECSPHNQQLAETLAEQLALAIANLQLRDALRQDGLRDPLTGLYNRRFLHEFLTKELARSNRSSTPIGLLMIDIDYFKSFNDHFGHSAGDFVLQKVAQAITSHVRPSDVICRYGGEEFIVVMPNANLAAATGRAEQLRIAVRQQRTEFQDQQFGGVTVSIGVAIYPDCGPNSDALLRAADNALYQAKDQGRNQVVAWVSP